MDDPTLSDGTYIVHMGEETQEWVECLAGQDLTKLDPLNKVPLHLLREDLEAKGDGSDFAVIREAVEVRETNSRRMISFPWRQ